MAKSTVQQFSIPGDWPGEDWACRQLYYPDSPHWRQIVTGLIYSLVRGRKWNADTGTITEAQAVGEQIFHRWLLAEPCLNCGEPEEGECREYLPNSPAITWWPSDPFLRPDYAITWPFPPLLTRYYTGNTWTGWFGLGETDVVSWWTTELGEPEEGDVPEFGAPSVTFHFRGTGVVELHLLQIPFGGYAFCVLDDDPLSTHIVEMAVNEVELFDPEGGISEWVAPHIEEMVVDSPGDHHIRVFFIPHLSALPPWMWLGGGLRKVVVCGEDIEGVVPVPEFTVGDDCRLYVQWAGGEPIEVTGEYNLCAEDGDDGQTGAEGPQGPAGPQGDPGECLCPGPEDPAGLPEYPPMQQEWYPGEDLACVSAWSVVEYFHARYDEIVAEMQQTQNILAFGTAIGGLFVLLGFTVAPGLGFALAQWFQSREVTYWENAWTTGFEQALLEALFCNARSDGFWRDAGWTGLVADVGAYAGEPIWDVVIETINGWGPIGTTNAGMMGLAPDPIPVCPDCGGWLEESFGGDGLDEWTIILKTAGGGQYSCWPTYNAGEDRIDGCTPYPVTGVGAVIEIDLPADTLIKSIIAEVQWNRTRPVYTDHVWGIYTKDSGENLTWIDQNMRGGSGVMSETFTWEGSAGESGGGGKLGVGGETRNHSSSDGSYYRIVKLTVSGQGTNPFE